MSTNTLKFQARANAVCPARTKVLPLIDAGTLDFKCVLGESKMAGGWPLYIDEEDRRNMFAVIHTVSDDASVWDDADIGSLKERDIELRVTGRTNNDIEGTITYEVPETAVSAAGGPVFDDEILSIIEEKIAAGIVTKEEMDERMVVFALNCVDRFLLKKVVSGYRKYKRPVRRPSTVYVDPFLDSRLKRGEEGAIAEGLRHGASRIAAICEGEKSVGKNVFLETIAWLMGMPMFLITFTRQMAPSSIYGEKTTDNSASEILKSPEAQRLALARVIAAGGKADDEVLQAAARFEVLKAQTASVNIVIDQSELYDWLEDGGLIVFNEMNMAEANFFASFTNQLLDGTGFIFIPGRGDVKIHPDCVLFGTQNADYEGTEQQNEATMSRFNCIHFPQPPTIKPQLLSAVSATLKRHGCDVELPKEYFDACEAFYSHCQAAVHEGDISNASLNIRGFVRALTTVAESGGVAKLGRWIQLSVINTCPTDEREALNAFLEELIKI